MFKYFCLSVFILFSIFIENLAFSQKLEQVKRNKAIDLIQFSKIKNKKWEQEKRKADSLAQLLGLTTTYLDRNDRIIVLQRLGIHNQPVYYATENIDAARLISADKVWFDENNNSFLTGEGIDVHVWDGGQILSNHQEFLNDGFSRIKMHNLNLSLVNHSTHIAGTIAASGFNNMAKGMAGSASVFGWDLNNDLAEMAIAASEGLLVSNHSYGPLCGWYYSSQVESWFWSGDMEISETEDYKFGYYDQVSADMDYIAWAAPEYLIVKSAGNDRNQTTSEPDQPHYIWNNDTESWEPVTILHEADGGEDGFDCLSPMAVPKNILTVGAVDENKEITGFSAFGPTDDGRIKPDVVTCGMDIFSSLAESVDSYGSYDGTSMAAASASGSTALLNHLQNKLQPGERLLSSTIKGILIHTAEDLGNEGPDYQYGWGLLNIEEACNLMSRNAANGGQNIIENEISEGQELEIPIETSSETACLKLTLCWTDPPGQVLDPSLNSTASKLVNDLNLVVENSNGSEIFWPWLLNLLNPSELAITGENHVDNVEQIMILNPGENEFIVTISHTGSLYEGKQSFSLIISGAESGEGYFPPRELSIKAAENNIRLNWFPPKESEPDHYNVYKNGLLVAEIVDTFYAENSLIFNELYNYYVKAAYIIEGEEKESLQTNSVRITPLYNLNLPLVIDFENNPEIIIKNTQFGWRLGNSETLSSYYLDFKNNTTQFIGIDSYSTGETSHVTDVAATPPLNLGEYENISISFDNKFVTGIYGAIDEMHIVYKLYEEEIWKDLINLPVATSWINRTYNLPEEICKNGTQIGFFYDDFYQPGMGAAIDNIVITGTPVRTVDFAITHLNSPVSACSLSGNEPVIITIENVGETTALPGDALSLQLALSPGVTSTENFVLTETVEPGEVIIHQLISSVDLSESGIYEFDFIVSGELDNNELTDYFNATVNVFGTPDLEIDISKEVFCLNDEAVLVEVEPEGGQLSGTGISDAYFSPIVAGTGNHLIYYSYADENGCEATTSLELVVNELPVPEILNQATSFCVDDEAILIEVEPGGGIFEGSGVSDGYFYPELAGPGEHKVTYYYTNENNCSSSTEVTFTVSYEPEILNENLVLCEGDAPVLIQVSPPGGVLSGTGVSGQYFDPQLAGVGTHLISYSFSQISSCEGIASKEIIVNPLPEVDILNLDLTFCSNDEPVLIFPKPEGGMLEGDGISGLYFDPALAGLGEHQVTYSYTNNFGCENNTGKVFSVFGPPLVSLGEDQSITTEETLVLVPSGNASSYYWYDGSAGEQLEIIGSTLGPGSFDIWVIAFNNHDCRAIDTLVLHVESSTHVFSNEVSAKPIIYPNPFSSKLYLNIPNGEKPDKIEIFSQKGTLIYLYSHPLKSGFDLSDIKTGIYTLKIHCTNETYVVKIIKI